MQSNKPLMSPTERGPGGGPIPVVANDARQACEVFLGMLAGTYEKDYGDFKRRISLYIDRLGGDLVGKPNEIVGVLSKMKEDLLFAQDEDIERMRTHLMRQAEALRQRL